MREWRKTVISQYANSPILLSILESYNSWVDPSADFDTFFKNVWDIDQATGYGLDVWGRIVGISRVIQIPSTVKFFGFNTPNKSYANFNHGPFFTRGGDTTQNYTLSDKAYRTLILFKAAANISDCTPISINRLLTSLFSDRGRVYIAHTGTMEITYVFEFILRTYEVSLLEFSDVLIRPSGVLVNFTQNAPTGVFGFKQLKGAARPFGFAPFRYT